MAHDNPYITVDTYGVRRIAGTRISLDSVVIGFDQGQSAEEIHRNFPALTLEQVYGAITYYLANRTEVEEYLREQSAVWENARAKGNEVPSAAVDRLRKLRLAKAGIAR